MATDAEIQQFWVDKTGGKKSPIAFLFNDAGDSVFHIDGTGLAALNVDTVDNEAHTWDNDVSNYPVEGIEDIADNIKQKPDGLTVTCFVSNTPVHGLIDEVTNLADRFLNGRKRTQETFNQLRALRDLRVPVTVATRYRVYEDMGITNVSIPRTPDDGESLTFDVTFKQINIVSAQSKKVPPGLGRAGAQGDNATKKRAAVNTSAGQNTGKDTSANPSAAVTKQKSVLSALGGFF